VSFVNAAIRGSDAFHGYLPEGGMDVVGFMATLEARLIQAALERAGTVAGAARLLSGSIGRRWSRSSNAPDATRN
jgi:hypothetical protein